MQFSSIRPIDRILSGATTPGLGGLGSDGNEGVLHIPQSFSIAWTSPWDCLVSYPGHTMRESYPSLEMQLVNTTAQLTGQTSEAEQCKPTTMTLPTMAGTYHSLNSFIIWYILCKLACTLILQNFWFALIIKFWYLHFWQKINPEITASPVNK